MGSTMTAQTNRPSFLSSLAYGFGFAIFLSIAGYLVLKSKFAIVPIILGLPGFLFGMFSNNSFHGGKDEYVAGVAWIVNGPIYFVLIHLFRLIRYKLKSRA